MRLLDRFLVFIVFVITARLPLRRVGATRRREQRRAADRRQLLYPTPIVKKETYDLLSQIMFSILAIMICCSLIVLDSMVQSVFSLVIIDLCRSSIDISSLICYLSIIFMIYSWIKIKLKVLIYSTHTEMISSISRYTTDTVF